MRQLMASDFYEATSSSANSVGSGTTMPGIYNSAPMSTSGLVGEGEDAANLVEFAKALRQGGVRFFGADW